MPDPTFIFQTGKRREIKLPSTPCFPLELAYRLIIRMGGDVSHFLSERTAKHSRVKSKSIRVSAVCYSTQR